jgi:putative transcriptional regulator
MVCDYWMMSFSGRLLIATPLIRDPNFIHTVVYIYAHDPEEGAAGVILNRPTDEPTVAHLPEWRSVLAAPPMVFWGGPVAQDSGVVLIDSGGKVELATDMTPPESSVRARLFVGQSGWGPGQLEGEVAEGAWLVTDAPAEDILGPFPKDLWRKLLRREGGRAAIWSTHPIDSRLN